MSVSEYFGLAVFLWAIGMLIWTFTKPNPSPRVKIIKTLTKMTAAGIKIFWRSACARYHGKYKIIIVALTVCDIFNLVIYKQNLPKPADVEEPCIMIKYKHGIEIVYTLRDTEYRCLMPTKRGPSNLHYAFTKCQPKSEEDDGCEDITPKIRMYAGPNLDFHKQLITPGMLGYNNVTIGLGDNEVTFNQGDIIIL